jgi:hypothetical protein
MTADKIKSYVLISVQFICLILIFASGRPFAKNYLLLALEVMGVALEIWAVIVSPEHLALPKTIEFSYFMLNLPGRTSVLRTTQKDTLSL